MKLKWEYCECGCHCFTTMVGSINYHLYDDLKGNYYLSEGRGCSWTKYKSWSAAEKAVKREVKKLYSQLKGIVNG